jgi:hypothetical protein
MKMRESQILGGEILKNWLELGLKNSFRGYLWAAPCFWVVDIVHNTKTHPGLSLNPEAWAWTLADIDKFLSNKQCNTNVHGG